MKKTIKKICPKCHQEVIYQRTAYDPPEAATFTVTCRDCSYDGVYRDAAGKVIGMRSEKKPTPKPGSGR